MGKKLHLKEIRVKSFVTSLENGETGNVKGGVINDTNVSLCVGACSIGCTKDFACTNGSCIGSCQQSCVGSCFCTEAASCQITCHVTCMASCDTVCPGCPLPTLDICY